LRIFRFLGPLGCLLLIFIIDQGSARVWGDQTLAPLLSVLSLFGLALVLGPFQILAWLPLFAVLSFWLIVDSSQFPLTRTVTVVLAGFLAAWAARQRLKTEDQNQQIERILGSLPVPWALIDLKGVILKSNGLGADLLGSNPEEIAGLSIFEVGADEETRKLRIHDFVKMSEPSSATAGKSFLLGHVAGSKQKLSAQVFRIPSRRGNASLLVLKELI
jgi:PAS domain S-box-containing protein